MNLITRHPLHTPSPARARALRRAAPIQIAIEPRELRTRRERAGLTLARAAELMGISANHLSRAERGADRRRLGATRIVTLLGLYEVAYKNSTPITITAIERSGPELLARAIAGGSDAPVRASREALERLAATFNARRL